MFCVSKKPKEIGGKMVERQRLILDCRQTNMLFRVPPVTHLGSLSALCEGHLQQDMDLFVGGGDIQDCFYACHIPVEMQRFFCMKHDISVADALDITGGVLPEELMHYPPSAKLCPTLCVLPMGFSRSFYLVQKLHESMTLRALGVSEDQLVVDGRPVPSFSKERCVGMPYCDNIHVLSGCPKVCEGGRNMIIEDLENIGFTVHEEVEASNIFPTLGGIIDGKAGQVRPNPKRLWGLVYCFNYAAEHDVSSDFIRRLLGHAMCICVLCRPGMSVFRSLYDFSSRDLPKQKLWKSAARECRILAGIIPLLIGDLHKPWATRLVCTDASPQGFGIAEKDVDENQAAQLGQWNERWRYKRLPPELWRHRDRALGLDVFNDIETACRPTPEDENAHEFVEAEDFPDVDFDTLDPSTWHTVKCGLWRDSSEHITLKEGRAFILALRRLSRSSQTRGRKVVMLVDNLGLALALSKGRAYNYQLLRVCQQSAAICLASGVAPRIRWVPSELNPADGPSRGSLEPDSSWSGFKLNKQANGRPSRFEVNITENPAHLKSDPARDEESPCGEKAQSFKESEVSHLGREIFRTENINC